MKKLLVSAYACEPLKGSEQAVGWNFVIQLAKHNQVHVITRANNQEPISKNIPKEIASNIHFHYYDTPSFFRRFKNKSKGIYLYYILWQIGIIKVISELKRQHNFNASIHLTFGNVWLPTFLPFINIPFIYGPLGGGESIPNSFISGLNSQQKLMQILRIILKFTIYINPLFLYAAYKAKFIICRTHNTQNLFPYFFQKKIRILTDGGIEKEIFKYHASNLDSNNLTIISTSRLIGFKNVITLIRSLQYISKDINYKCVIIGSGPEKDKIKKASRTLKLDKHIIYKENLTRDEVLKELETASIFVSPSLRDACNLSLLEAMAIGLPVICLNWSGMAISTDDNCAIRLPVTNPEQMPKDMAKAIMKLAKDPNLRKQMGENGRKRIQTVFNWEAKGKFMEELLAELDKK